MSNGILQKGNHSLLDNPLIPIQALNINFHLEPKDRKPEINRKENVMSERVKMPSRHFLRSNYLHIFFSIKFWVFVSLVPQFVFKMRISILNTATTEQMGYGIISFFVYTNLQIKSYMFIKFYFLDSL